jgi:uncharacterized protein YndB with AHSA1/START domain
VIALRPETLDFVDRAPLRVSQATTVGAPPLRVFAAFADAPSWPRWFPLMRRASWTSAEIERVGAEREVALHLLGVYRERFLAWEPGVRFAFTMTETSSPLAKAIVEDFQMAPVRDGEATRLSWTLAAEPSVIGRAARPVIEGLMRRVFLASGPRLEAYLRRR